MVKAFSIPGFTEEKTDAGEDDSSDTDSEDDVN